MSEIIRPLTPQETCAMYHYHHEYASLGIGAIAYYKGLSQRDKSFIDDMTAAILKAAQQGGRRTAKQPRKKTVSGANRWSAPDAGEATAFQAESTPEVSEPTPTQRG